MSMHPHRGEQPLHLLPRLCCLLEHDGLGLLREGVRLGGAGREAAVGSVV